MIENLNYYHLQSDRCLTLFFTIMNFRERNRRHARLSREKKKETLKSMQLQISESKRENELLRQILIKALGMDQAEILLKENNLTLDSSDGPHGDATSTCDSSSNGVDEPDDYTEINS